MLTKSSRKSRIPYVYIVIAVVLAGLLAIPKHSVERIQREVVAVLSPLWERLANKKKSLLQQDLQKIKVQNQMLRSELAQARELYLHELELNSRLAGLLADIETPSTASSAELRHLKEGRALLESSLTAIPAHVVFRSATSWNSVLWIDVGTADNMKYGREVIAKNSPVVVGDAIVGVIDNVGVHQSRVRLITDGGLNPSVRSVRGTPVHKHIRGHVDILVRFLEQNPSGAGDDLINQLKGLSKSLSNKNEALYLAKGELQGSGSPLWRAGGTLLRGTGFNYDFADEDGPARDLRLGHAILNVHDLLVTTGMDGVFPPGFIVGEVTHVGLLREGDYYYDLEAKPAVIDLEELTDVFVLAPVMQK